MGTTANKALENSSSHFMLSIQESEIQIVAVTKSRRSDHFPPYRPAHDISLDISNGTCPNMPRAEASTQGAGGQMIKATSHHHKIFPFCMCVLMTHACLKLSGLQSKPNLITGTIRNIIFYQQQNFEGPTFLFISLLC